MSYFFVVIFLPFINLVCVDTLLIAPIAGEKPELKLCTLEKPPPGCPSILENSEFEPRPDPPPKHKSPELPRPKPPKGDIPKGERCPPSDVMNGDEMRALPGNSCL